MAAAKKSSGARSAGRSRNVAKRKEVDTEVRRNAARKKASVRASSGVVQSASARRGNESSEMPGRGASYRRQRRRGMIGS